MRHSSHGGCKKFWWQDPETLQANKILELLLTKFYWMRQNQQIGNEKQKNRVYRAPFQFSMSSPWSHQHLLYSSNMYYSTAP